MLDYLFLLAAESAADTRSAHAKNNIRNIAVIVSINYSDAVSMTAGACAALFSSSLACESNLSRQHDEGFV